MAIRFRSDRPASSVRRDVLFQAGLPGGTLAAVAARLGAALDACGYAERAWFSIPGGFALVTRLEQINDDGTPKSGAARWAAEPPRQIAGIRDYMRALFSAPGGRFRVVVFLVTDEPVGGGTPAPARAEAVGWLREGALSLPPEIAAQPLGDAHQAYAYIYEFEKQGDAEARFLAESRLTAQAHLNAAGLLMALGARP
jgi:hypothetical protein